MIDTSSWATLASPACLVLAPANLGLHPEAAPASDSDLTFMATAAAVVGDVPVSTVLAHRPRTLHLRQEVQRTADSLDEVLEQGELAVDGADVARWVRGHWVLEEALTEHGRELVTRVVVPVRHEFVSLAVRVPRDDVRGLEIADTVVASMQIILGPASP